MPAWEKVEIIKISVFHGENIIWTVLSDSTFKMTKIILQQSFLN